VLSPGDEAVPRGGGQVRSAGRDEIDRHWAGRGLHGYATRLTLIEPVPALWGGVQDTLHVRVENLGEDVWPWGGGGLPEIRVGCWWLCAREVREGPRASLPADLGPGGSEIVPLPFVPPSESGDYTLEIDLVHEHVRWFDVPLRVETSVAPRRLAAVLDPGSREGLAAALEALDPGEEPVVLTGDPDGLSRVFAGAIRSTPEDRGRRLALPRLLVDYRRVLAGTDRLVVPVTLLERERRLPLLAAVVAARFKGIPAATSAGGVLTATAVLSRRLR